MNGLRRIQRILQRAARRAAGLAVLLVAFGATVPLVLAQPPAPVPATPRPPAAVNMDNCRRCFVQARFLQQLQSQPVESEPVEIKNGVGLFYTATRAKYIAPMRDLVRGTLKELHEINQHPEYAHLCVICQRDFPVYSKFDHEIVPLNRGVLVLITSDDPKAVEALRQLYARRRNYVDMDKLREQMEELRQEAERMRVNDKR